ncbi:unnamed protein product [Vitrella brassicaformis CCMP3155]|uniref:adenine phosphoribosyltransferase n=1 Tax=Vitrella brassicaformis (strain CCMP3155) TaxID=1169540 RepID=A0A0G4EV99_VITBC|nr:unnamed protein product [Vitrella brassicaformis CCMP3155]|eukprot:CEM02190.1 unnamed protein product [Vitrella brassicaformis CCMP3155]
MAPRVIEVEPSFFRLDPDDEQVQEIAKCLPGFDFKGVPAFFDVGGIVTQPDTFQRVIDLFVQRYNSDPSQHRITKVAGFEARGFVFGPPIALALKVPFVMLRKKGKLPGPVMMYEYETEYSQDNLCCACTAIKEGQLAAHMHNAPIHRVWLPGDRVLLIDDLLATGGTLIAGAKLVQGLGGEVVECCLVTVIEGLKGWRRFHEAIKEIPIFTLVDCARTPSMPEGSTASYTVEMHSEEARCIRDAVKDADSRSVLIKSDGGSYTTGIPGADGKYNERYLEEAVEDTVETQLEKDR